MNKSDIYNTLKTRQLQYAIKASKSALKCNNLVGEALEMEISSAKKAHIKSTTLLGAINELLGTDYNGFKAMTIQNMELLEHWNELEQRRLNL